MQVIDDHDNIYNVIDHDYIASWNGNYDYLRSFNRLQSITDYNYPNPCLTSFIICVCIFVLVLKIWNEGDLFPEDGRYVICINPFVKIKF